MKRSAVQLVVLFSLAGCLAGVGSAQEIANVAGSWDVSFRISGETVRELWVIEQDGGGLSATIKSAAGEMKATGEVNSIAFRFDFKDSGGSDKKIRATVLGDTMNGSITIGKKEYLWSAKRSKTE